MELLWQRADAVLQIIGFFVNALIVIKFYSPYFRKKYSAWIVGGIYFFGIMTLYMIPVGMSGALAYAFGIMAVLTASITIEPWNIPQKVFLALNVYLIRWISYGFALFIWDFICGITFQNPRVESGTMGQFVLFIIASVLNILIANGR